MIKPTVRSDGRHRVTTAVALGMALVLAPLAARADCKSGILELSRALPSVTDPHVRALLQTDLRGAEVELWEFDEAECATVLAHAQRVLATAAASAPADGQSPGVARN